MPRQNPKALQSIENLLDSTAGWQGRLLRTACLVLPFVFFAYVIFADMPTGLVTEIHAKNPVILLLLGLFFVLAYRLRGWMGVLAGLGATLLVFAIELVMVWSTAASDGDVLIGGLLPWSDANQYYAGAQLLVDGGQLAPWHGRRPWFMSLLAVLLGASQDNLQWSIAILVAIAALACFLFAKSVQASLGVVSAVAALLILLLFYSRFIGTTMSEHLGLSLGAIALAVLWQSTQQPRLWLVGLWLLTLALVARAGAFFVLPALLVWATWHSYHHGGRRECLKTLILGCVAIGLGFLLDALLRRSLVPDVPPFGNFSYTLYGLVAGNKGWLQVRQDHPEILNLGEIEAARQVYQLAFKAFLADPQTAVMGAFGALRDYFSFTRYGLFTFIPGLEARIVAYILSGLGLANCLWHWRKAQYSMVLAMTIGVLLSVPFVPPIDAYGMRIYAATIPLSALLVALGIAFPLSLISDAKPLIIGRYNWVAPAIGTLVVLVTFIGSVSMKLLIPPVLFDVITCPPDQRGLFVRFSRGSSIQLIEDNSRSVTHLPEVLYSDFNNGVQSYQKWYPELYLELINLQPGQSVRYATNLAKDRHGEGLWLVHDTSITPGTELAHVCAVGPDDNAGIFYRADAIYPAAEFAATR